LLNREAFGEALKGIGAVIFDLDGVIVSTDECHYKAWKAIADGEGIRFDRIINRRLRGVSRMESLEILLERARRPYSREEKETLARRKNEIYMNLITELSPRDILPGALAFISGLKSAGIRVAVASSSKNAPFILERLGLRGLFDAAVSGNDITKSKPAPEAFELAARRLGVEKAGCLVVEDAAAGVDAALACGMTALGVGDAAGYRNATFKCEGLDKLGSCWAAQFPPTGKTE
jgi:beta-phosphoglucomutase